MQYSTKLNFLNAKLFEGSFLLKVVQKALHGETHRMVCNFSEFSLYKINYNVRVNKQVGMSTPVSSGIWLLYGIFT